MNLLFNSRLEWSKYKAQFKLKGDIFAGGVTAVNGRFHPGDEVVLVREEAVVGVGVAQIASSLLKESQRGRVVKVRHRG